MKIRWLIPSNYQPEARLPWQTHFVKSAREDHESQKITYFLLATEATPNPQSKQNAVPNVIINSACRRNGFPHLTLTYTEKKYSLVRKKNVYKIRELDSVNVHENEALVKGNKQKQKKKQKKKKKK